MIAPDLQVVAHTHQSMIMTVADLHVATALVVTDTVTDPHHAAITTKTVDVMDALHHVLVAQSMITLHHVVAVMMIHTVGIHTHQQTRT